MYKEQQEVQNSSKLSEPTTFELSIAHLQATRDRLTMLLDKFQKKNDSVIGAEPPQEETRDKIPVADGKLGLLADVSNELCDVLQKLDYEFQRYSNTI